VKHVRTIPLQHQQRCSGCSPGAPPYGKSHSCCKRCCCSGCCCSIVGLACREATPRSATAATVIPNHAVPHTLGILSLDCRVLWFVTGSRGNLFQVEFRSCLDALPLGPEREMNWLQQAVLDSRHDEPARRAIDASSQCPGLCVRAWAFVCSRRETALLSGTLPHADVRMRGCLHASSHCVPVLFRPRQPFHSRTGYSAHFPFQITTIASFRFPFYNTTSSIAHCCAQKGRTRTRRKRKGRDSKSEGGKVEVQS
jgi:hypothetical protein